MVLCSLVARLQNTHSNKTVNHLARVLAPLHVSGTEHGVGEHAGVGVVTDLPGEDGDIHTLQTVAVGRCSTKTKQ